MNKTLIEEPGPVFYPFTPLYVTSPDGDVIIEKAPKIQLKTKYTQFHIVKQIEKLD
jgi:hypothetical protein